ncbi:uncharacterized protein BDZ99DRAFT_569497 [Mytilinidion resinicola]|uniref:Uncharacterized protein n=1 Tax=Mytilinidion resinicola TaxID=574789 RepID=A0A6A6YR98_9PEZI|nr:uncharacterized protein BDZ99DRAFT_569497 [Mytilinidion resinicola]KAF2811446.1 hypothetical protein BDZ99DRAFT_569497 [Mytilinidion resinicola]
MEKQVQLATSLLPDNRNDYALSIFRTSKQVYEESSKIFFEQAVFTFAAQVSGPKLPMRFLNSPQSVFKPRIRLIRSLDLIVFCESSRSTLLSSPILEWNRLLDLLRSLPNLRYLSLDVRDHANNIPVHGQPSIEKDLLNIDVGSIPVCQLDEVKLRFEALEAVRECWPRYYHPITTDNFYSAIAAWMNALADALLKSSSRMRPECTISHAVLSFNAYDRALQAWNSRIHHTYVAACHVKANGRSMLTRSDMFNARTESWLAMSMWVGKYQHIDFLDELAEPTEDFADFAYRRAIKTTPALDLRDKGPPPVYGFPKGKYVDGNGRVEQEEDAAAQPWWEYMTPKNEEYK